MKKQQDEQRIVSSRDVTLGPSESQERAQRIQDIQSLYNSTHHMVPCQLNSSSVTPPHEPQIKVSNVMMDKTKLDPFVSKSCLWKDCPSAHVVFETELDVYQHVLDCHVVKGKQSCLWMSIPNKPPCNTHFLNRGNFTDHLSSHFSSYLKPYECQWCDKACRNRQELRRHEVKNHNVQYEKREYRRHRLAREMHIARKRAEAEVEGSTIQRHPPPSPPDSQKESASSTTSCPQEPTRTQGPLEYRSTEVRITCAPREESGTEKSYIPPHLRTSPYRPVQPAHYVEEAPLHRASSHSPYRYSSLSPTHPHYGDTSPKKRPFVEQQGYPEYESVIHKIPKLDIPPPRLSPTQPGHSFIQSNHESRLSPTQPGHSFISNRDSFHRQAYSPREPVYYPHQTPVYSLKRRSMDNEYSKPSHRLLDIPSVPLPIAAPILQPPPLPLPQATSPRLASLPPLEVILKKVKEEIS